MVRMADPAPCIDPRIAALCLPRPLRCFPVLFDQALILPLAHTVWVFGTHINEFTCHTIELLHNMGLARTAAKRLVAQNEFLVDAVPLPNTDRHKEPFSLAAKRCILAAVTQSSRHFES